MRVKQIKTLSMIIPRFKKETKGRMDILLKEAETPLELKRIQSILLGSLGTKSQEVGLVVGWTPGYIRTVWSRYRKEGETFLLGERRGKSRSRAYLTLEEEKEFLTPYLERAKNGKILVTHELRKSYEKLVGKKVAKSLIYKILSRHGWRKIVPSHHHPRRNIQAQKEFKEKSFPPES